MPEAAPDTGALAALHAACFTTPRPWSADEIAALCAPPHGFLLTEPGDGLPGFLVGRAVAGEAELLTLAVAPEARRQGIGGRLVRRFRAEARARGAESAHLEVAADNLAAQALYLAAGFSVQGQRRGYYRRPEGGSVDAVVMVSRL